ncbi:MAG TPA: hypothetical protein VMX76_02835 [Nevskiaceae bacterium]|nr:hypothetical protein [Nevskiaceae bacterium]
MNKEIEIRIRPSETAKVSRYTEDLRNVLLRSEGVSLEQALAEWADRIIERRFAWLEQNKDCFAHLEGTEVKKGFQLVLFEYMDISPEEVPIIEETETKITWHAYDFCPYFEAIKALGMDTRIVCKYALETPVQVLLNALNPRLRFSRNYKKVRPYSDYCEEIIELVE